MLWIFAAALGYVGTLEEVKITIKSTSHKKWTVVAVEHLSELCQLEYYIR